MVYSFKYNGKEFDSKNGLNWYDYGARHYDAALGRFTTVDPLGEVDYGIASYTYCSNNPILYIDPTGTLTSPIYDEEGNLLGTDDEGLQGRAIVMEETDFKQGMSHEEAEKKDLGISALQKEGAYKKFLTSFLSLKDRPDWDGYLTKTEADNWWLEKSGEPLFVDQSKIKLPGITKSSFRKNKKISKNFIWGLTNTGKVYGTLTMILIDSQKGKVLLGSDKFVDKYDYNMDGRLLRDFATWFGRPGNKNDGRDFLIKGYGHAIIPVIIK